MNTKNSQRPDDMKCTWVQLSGPLWHAMSRGEVGMTLCRKWLIGSGLNPLAFESPADDVRCSKCDRAVKAQTVDEL